MSKIVHPLPAGAFTLTGKTQGPAIAIGRCRYGRTQAMYMHETELRDACAAMGWANDKVHAVVAADLERAKTELAAAKLLLSDQAEKIETLERALGWKPEKPEKKAAH